MRRTACRRRERRKRKRRRKRSERIIPGCRDWEFEFYKFYEFLLFLEWEVTNSQSTLESVTVASHIRAICIVQSLKSAGMTYWHFLGFLESILPVLFFREIVAK